MMEKIRCQSCFREYEGDRCPHCGGAQNEEHQLPVGTMLHGRYQIGKVLGQGGFGITYLGRDQLLGTIVAVKEFFPGNIVYRRVTRSLSVECIDQTMAPHFNYSKERFLREASALVKFRDLPEVVDILGFSEENNTAYIVMEYVKGMNLAAYVNNRGGKLSVEETFRILRPVMEALAKVHRSGIVHRDISPDNIILDPMGGAKLLDFGAVRAVEDPDIEKELNKSTEAIIKQGFAPIEQYNTRGSLGPWTDEYAMCATVWYCLTGKVPDEASIRMSEGIDPDWNSIEGLSAYQQEALAKGFSCRAKDRYKDLDELLNALFSSQKQAPKVGSAPKTVSEELLSDALHISVKTPKESTGRKSPLRITPLAVVIALVILIGCTVLLRIRIPMWRYSKAEALLMEGHFEEAINRFSQLGDYKDSKEKINECHYQWAESLITEKNFHEAIDKFTWLGGYKDSFLRCAYAEAEILLLDGRSSEAAIAFGKLGDHSNARIRSFAVWDTLDRDTVDAGDWHTIGMRSGGTVLAVGYNGYGQCDVSGWSDIVAVSAGGYHTVGLRSDGTVVAVGADGYGRCDVSSWSDIVAVSAGGYHTVGLRADGTVVAVGLSSEGQCDVSNWTDIIAVSAGGNHTVGLRSDGTVVAAGQNVIGECEVSSWTDIVAVEAGYRHTVGLRSDGTVVAVGLNGDDQCSTINWTDIVAISAGYYHTAGLRSDGTVVAVGFDDLRCDTSDWTGIVALSAGYYHTVGLRTDGTLVATSNEDTTTNNTDYGQTEVGTWTDILVPNIQIHFE